MNSYLKKRYTTVAVASLIIHLAVYLLFHLPTLVIYIENDFWYDAVYYLHDLLYKLISMMLAPVCAAVALAVCPEGGIRRPLLLCGGLALTKLIYLLPYTYNYALLSYGYDSVSGLLISVGVGVGYTLLGTGYAYLLYIMILKVGKRALEKANGKTATKELNSVPTKGIATQSFIKKSDGGILDLSSPRTAAIFSACFLQFCVFLIAELVEIIVYLAEYAGTYRAGEILYIVASLLTLFVGLFATHFLNFGIIKLLNVKDDLQNEEH